MIVLLIPAELSPYVDFEEGEIVTHNLPPELKSAFEKLKKTYESAKADKYTDF